MDHHGQGNNSLQESRARFDLRGGSCGWCILKIKSLLKDLEPGQMIEVLVTDPATVSDLAAVLRPGPDRMLDSIKDNGFNRIFVQKS